MIKEIIFPLLTIIFYTVVELFFRYYLSKYKYEIIFLVSIIFLFILYILAPSKEFFVIPLVIGLLCLVYNLKDAYNRQKIENIFSPKIENLLQVKKEQNDKEKEIIVQWETSDIEIKKTLELFYLIEEISKNLSLESLIKEIYKVVNIIYPNVLQYIAVLRSVNKEITTIIEFPEHKDYVNKMELHNITKDIIILGGTNIYVSDFSFNGDNVKILAEYKVAESDSEFLEYIQFLFTKLSPVIKRSVLFTEVEELSRIDGLTGLYLRRYILKKLQEETIRAYRYNTPYSLLMIDIDFFKKINDSYGHLIGDKLLSSLSKIFKEDVGGKGLIARWGGEEFLVLLPYTDKKQAYKIAESLRKKVEENKFYFANLVLNITISIGVASFPEDGTDYNQIISVSDNMLYEAKRSGRNKVISSLNLP